MSLGGGAVFVANAAVSVGTRFVPIEPCRLLDTRSSSQVGMRLGKIGPTDPVASADQTVKNDLTVIFDPDADALTTTISGTSRPLMGNTALNTGAELNGCDTRLDTDGDAAYDAGDINPDDEPLAVVINVTVLNSSAASFITVYPWEFMEGDNANDKLRRPFVSHLNPISSHGPITNSVTVALSDTSTAAKIEGASCNTSPNFCQGYKAFRIYNNQGTTDVIIDVVGYYTTTTTL